MKERDERRIVRIVAREVLDSRGTPTVEVDVRLAGGAWGRASVPVGASTGRAEALELRDGDPHRYQGQGVSRAVRHVVEEIAPALVGRDAARQEEIDRLLQALDGTARKSRLGANAVLGVSLAVARAAATACDLPLYRYLGGAGACELPVPMVNILSGGLHAGRSVDFQDFLVIPLAATRFSEALAMVSTVRQSTGELLRSRGASTLVADEGGYAAPGSHEAALELLLAATERAGYRPGEDVALGLDVAATHFFANGRYQLQTEGQVRTSQEMVELLAALVTRYPILSLEDPLAEDDWTGWGKLSARLGNRVQLIGDDLFVTRAERLRQGIARGIANAVLIKVNQVGTLSEALTTLRLAWRHGYLPVISARSGETEDTTIADLAVATGAGQIKIGSLTRSERLAKYNHLLRIEEELGEQACYRGRDVFARFLAGRVDRTRGRETRA